MSCLLAVRVCPLPPGYVPHAHGLTVGRAWLCYRNRLSSDVSQRLRAVEAREAAMGSREKHAQKDRRLRLASSGRLPTGSAIG